MPEESKIKKCKRRVFSREERTTEMKLPAKARAGAGRRTHAADDQSDAASSDDAAASSTPSEDSHDSDVCL